MTENGILIGRLPPCECGIVRENNQLPQTFDLQRLKEIQGYNKRVALEETKANPIRFPCSSQLKI